jgi:hypothetical protein
MQRVAVARAWSRTKSYLGERAPQGNPLANLDGEPDPLWA